MSLSDLACRYAKPQSKPYKMYDSAGLFLEIRPTGKSIWRFKYKTNDKEKVLTIGKYPKVSLVKAREARDVALNDLENGIDPAVQKKEDRLLAKYKSAQTFERVARQWHEEYQDRWSKRHRDTMLTRLENHVFPYLGSLPIAEIKAPIIYACVKKIEDRKNGEMAKRILQIIGQVFRYAVLTGRAEDDVTRNIRGGLKPYEKGHFAALAIDELPKFLKQLNKNEVRLYRQTYLAMRLMLLTFVRTSELINARWSEFNLENAVWSIPAERMKMRIAHTVPLSKQAIEILKELEVLTKKPSNARCNLPDFVFPSVTKRGKAMSDGTLLMAIRRLKYQGKMTGHGFRASAMSAIKERLGYRHEVVDRQLAHFPRNKIDRAYDRATYMQERNVMMQDWSDYIEKLESAV
ncbi:MAG TPA: tyrosine-type recombinase/integrase [Flavipsychrobacter sp.]|nr:tyrosine-type recombinase/integrase [Flavipsychrobacter sp.]